jgi:hypothetical protein
MRWWGAIAAGAASADCPGVGTILHDRRPATDADDLIALVEETFVQAQRVFGRAIARQYLRLREDDFYRHLEAMGLEDRVPAARAVYAQFWRLHADV